MSPSSLDLQPADSGVCEGALVAGKYRVGKILGAGGMGVVLAAAHETLGTPMALKVLRPEAVNSPGMVGRFLQEARAAALLQSEHVARVHDFGTLEDGSPYLAMEYLHGRDLAYVLAKRPRLSVAESVEIIRQTCDAVAEAHAAGIVHRDLKPHNLFLLSRPNHAIFVKVLDFGIAKVLGSERFRVEVTTQSTAMLGTPLYMAPEQLKAAKTADGRSDIWSLGVIFHQMLTGQVPFDAQTLPELSVMVLTTDAAPIDSARFSLPEELAQIVAKCLRRDPAERFGSVEELAMALDPFVSNRRVSIPDLSSPVLDAITTGPRRALVPGDGEFPTSSKLGANWPSTTSAPVAVDVAPPAWRFPLRSNLPVSLVAATFASDGKSPVEPPPPAPQPVRKRILFGLAGLGVLVGGVLVFALVPRAVEQPLVTSASAPLAPAALAVAADAAVAPAVVVPSVGDWDPVAPTASSSVTVEPRTRKDRTPRAVADPQPVMSAAASSASSASSAPAGPKIGTNGAPILAN